MSCEDVGPSRSMMTPSLIDLVTELHESKPTFTVELFIRGTDSARSEVLTDDGVLRKAALATGDHYHAPTVFQLKTMLYHAGFLTESGTEPHKLNPATDAWELREPLENLPNTVS